MVIPRPVSAQDAAAATARILDRRRLLRLDSADELADVIDLTDLLSGCSSRL